MSDADASFLREQKADFKPISFHALQRERTLRFIHRAGALVSRAFRARADTFHDESSDLNAAPDGFLLLHPASERASRLAAMATSAGLWTATNLSALWFQTEVSSLEKPLNLCGAS